MNTMDASKKKWKQPPNYPGLFAILHDCIRFLFYLQEKRKKVALKYVQIKVNKRKWLEKPKKQQKPKQKPKEKK